MYTMQYLIYEGRPGTQLSWVPRGQHSTIPHGAILGGHGEDGRPIYIAKISPRAGFYDPRKTYVVYGIYGKNNTFKSNQWDYLVITYCKYAVNSFPWTNGGMIRDDN